MRPILIVAAEQDYFCYYCRHRMVRHKHISGEPIPRDAMTQDHVTPRVLGGQTSTENLVAACHQCNFIRGEIDDEVFRNILEKWFKKNPTLWIRWHHIPFAEVAERKRHCTRIHAKMLNGKAIRHREFAYRHYDFFHRARRILLQAT